jgi:glycerol-3-phosphate O-acyltransferase / dihydroxyacetone phosphate acyltransferase
MLLLIFTLPLFVLGVLINYIPFRLPFFLAKKIVKNIEFFASVNFTLGTFIFLGWYALFSILIAINFSWIWSLSLLLLGPLFGRFALNYRRLCKEVLATRRLKQKSGLAENLLEEKMELIKLLNKWVIKIA